ncbi:putative protein TPRXL [Tripterygium wilfordii]|uniref:putative protein TPRXL n=1 Tax=Tripterygium wilfordii TaxID=458696 RepID=UPI0018F8477E|nr:putative protein TPRXL [Tripterygium wilfordii]
MAATSASSRRPGFRSHSPSGRFPSSSSSAFASSSSSFSSRPSNFFQRSASPTRVNVYGHSAMSSWFSLDRPVSPNRSMSAVGAKPSHQVVKRQSGPKRTCLCSPTTHPGSFRCSLHKNFGGNSQGGSVSASNRLNARRSAMTNSLVRIGGVEGDLVKRALAALIRPSSHQQRRRTAFQLRPSRLSVMCKAADS